MICTTFDIGRPGRDNTEGPWRVWISYRRPGLRREGVVWLAHHVWWQIMAIYSRLGRNGIEAQEPATDCLGKYGNQQWFEWNEEASITWCQIWQWHPSSNCQGLGTRPPQEKIWYRATKRKLPEKWQRCSWSDMVPLICLNYL